MNVIEFDRQWKTNIVFCMVDRINSYDPDIRPLIKNQADLVLSNIYNKGYKILQWTDEDVLLKAAANTSSDYALVFSTGTEFTNGSKFFDNIERLVQSDFFIAGHVLDRKDAYYELHHQCYLINLKYYRQFDHPAIGQQSLGSRHWRHIPNRSSQNYHDDYTPLWVSHDRSDLKEYQHKCHGWNILSIALDNKLPVLIFDESIRNNKIYFYPESVQDFHKQLAWAYHRLDFCKNQFVHMGSTETVDVHGKYQQIITPASSDWYIDHIQQHGKVVYYDYNQQSLDYWMANRPNIDTVEFEFVRCDLLGQTDFLDKVNPNLKTFVNLSNIFNYEGTAFFYSQGYREHKQQQLVEKIKDRIKDVDIFFSMPARLFDIVPTWHIQ